MATLADESPRECLSHITSSSHCRVQGGAPPLAGDRGRRPRQAAEFDGVGRLLLALIAVLLTVACSIKSEPKAASGLGAGGGFVSSSGTSRTQIGTLTPSGNTSFATSLAGEIFNLALSGPLTRLTWVNDRGGGGTLPTTGVISLVTNLQQGENRITITGTDPQAMQTTLTLLVSRAGTLPTTVSLAAYSPQLASGDSYDWLRSTVIGGVASEQHVLTDITGNGSGGVVPLQTTIRYATASGISDSTLSGQVGGNLQTVQMLWAACATTPLTLPAVINVGTSYPYNLTQYDCNTQEPLARYEGALTFVQQIGANTGAGEFQDCLQFTDVGTKPYLTGSAPPATVAATYVLARKLGLVQAIVGGTVAPNGPITFLLKTARVGGQMTAG